MPASPTIIHGFAGRRALDVRQHIAGPAARKIVASDPRLIQSATVALGEMAEWFKAHAWKACLPKGNVGSNPSLSAIFTINDQ
jgi:hypothetical protein